MASSSGPPQRDPYAVLNVPPDASQTEIRQAYQRLARVMHPDKNPLAASAPSVFHDVEQAWKSIGSEEDRRIYDELGHRGVNAMQMVKAQYPNDTIRDLLERVRTKVEDMETAEDLKRFNINGSIRADTTLKDLVEHGSFNFIAMQEAVEFPLSPTDSVSLSGAAGVRRGETVLGSISLTHRHLISHGHLEWSTTSTSIGQPATLGIKLKRLVWRKLKGEFEFLADAEGDAGMSLGLKRNFGMGFHGSISLGVGLLDGVRMSARHVKTDKEWVRAVESNLTMGVQGLGLDASWMQPLTENIKGVLSLRALGSAMMELEMELQRLLSTFTLGSLAASISGYGVSLKLRLARGGLRFEVPVLLTSQPSVMSFMLTSVLPVLGHVVVDYVVKPRSQRWEKEAMDMAVAEVAKARSQARMQRSLMLVTAAARRQEEEDKFGLVIIIARYGCKLNESFDWTAEVADNIDVTQQLSFFIKDSHLAVSGGNLSHLLGFYNPCALHDGGKVMPQLFVRYKLGTQVFEIFFKAADKVELPNPRAVHMGDVSRGRWEATD